MPEKDKIPISLKQNMAVAGMLAEESIPEEGALAGAIGSPTHHDLNSLLHKNEPAGGASLRITAIPANVEGNIVPEICHILLPDGSTMRVVTSLAYRILREMDGEPRTLESTLSAMRSAELTLPNVPHSATVEEKIGVIRECLANKLGSPAGQVRQQVHPPAFNHSQN